MTQLVVARVLGVNVRTLRKWDVPANLDGSYSLPKVHAWRLEQVEIAAVDKATKAKAPQVEDEFEIHKTRFMKSKADRAEIELAEKRGELVRVSEVETTVARACETVKRNLLALPGTLAPRVSGLPVPDVAIELEGGIRDALDELVAAFERELDELDADADETEGEADTGDTVVLRDAAAEL